MGSAVNGFWWHGGKVNMIAVNENENSENWFGVIPYVLIAVTFSIKDQSVSNTIDRRILSNVS